jgi:hypothetical protein
VNGAFPVPARPAARQAHVPNRAATKTLRYPGVTAPSRARRRRAARFAPEIVPAEADGSEPLAGSFGRTPFLSFLPGPSAGQRRDRRAADDAVAPDRGSTTRVTPRSSTRTSGQAKTAGRRPKQQTECADPAQALVSEHRQAVVEACQTERYQRGSRGLSRVLLREPAPERGVDSHLSSSHRRAARQMSEPREMTLETAKCGWN